MTENSRYGEFPIRAIVGTYERKRISPDEQKPFIKLVDRNLAAKQRDAGAGTSALEREIDELVHALYGLTPEDIQLVEGVR